MIDDELLEWYKNHSGAKPEDMSQKDYEINVNRALKIQNNKALKENLANQQSAINLAQSQAQQSASVSNEKLMKYLGQRNLASGLAIGQTGSDYINANNNYIQQRSKINNDALLQQQQLLESYTNTKMANEENAINKEIKILDKYRSRDIEDEQLQRERENQERSKYQWELDMEAYRQNIENNKEDRENAKQDKQKGIDTENNEYWLQAAIGRMTSMAQKLEDENGYLTDEAKSKILKEMGQYQNKFNDTQYYEKLLDLYNTYITNDYYYNLALGGM